MLLPALFLPIFALQQVQFFKSTDSNEVQTGLYGSSLALSQNPFLEPQEKFSLAVGATHERCAANTEAAGAVYVHKYSSTGLFNASKAGTQCLSSPYSYATPDLEFGAAVALSTDGKHLFVGAPGAYDGGGVVVHWVRDDNTKQYLHTETILPPMSTWSDVRFGASLAVPPDAAALLLAIGAPHLSTCAVGSYYVDDLPPELTSADSEPELECRHRGGVFLYTIAGSFATPHETHLHTPPGGDPRDERGSLVGASVAFGGNLFETDALYVGAPGYNDNRGALLVLPREALVVVLYFGNMQTFDGHTPAGALGTSIAVDASHSLLVVGAPAGAGAGAVEVYEATAMWSATPDSKPVYLTTVSSSAAGPLSQLGAAVAAVSAYEFYASAPLAAQCAAQAGGGACVDSVGAVFGFRRYTLTSSTFVGKPLQSIITQLTCARLATQSTAIHASNVRENAKMGTSMLSFRDGASEYLAVGAAHEASCSSLLPLVGGCTDSGAVYTFAVPTPAAPPSPAPPTPPTPPTPSPPTAAANATTTTAPDRAADDKNRILGIPSYAVIAAIGGIFCVLLTVPLCMLVVQRRRRRLLSQQFAAHQLHAAASDGGGGGGGGELMLTRGRRRTGSHAGYRSRNMSLSHAAPASRRTSAVYFN